jgi:hypothetical protein
MRPSQGYKIVGALLIVPSVLAIVLALMGQTSAAGPGVGLAIIGFLIYRRGMTLALRGHESDSPSGHLAMLTVWARQIRARVLRQK